MLTLLLALSLTVSNVGASCPMPNRSQRVIYEFRKQHPCPATGVTTGACPGWEVDHVIPLACCGKDELINLRWLESDLHRLRHQRGLQCWKFKPRP